MTRQTTIISRSVEDTIVSNKNLRLSALFAARALELGLSIRDLAARLEVSEARARQILGAKNLREDNIQRVAAALGLRLALALVEKT